MNGNFKEINVDKGKKVNSPPRDKRPFYMSFSLSHAFILHLVVRKKRKWRRKRGRMLEEKGKWLGLRRYHLNFIINLLYKRWVYK